MGILLVTGKSAEESVRECAREMPVDARVHASPINVASLLSIGGIIKELEAADLTDISMVIIPGSVQGDASRITGKTGIPCFKGPRNLRDLPWIIEKVSSGGLALSATIPADELLNEEMSYRARDELSHLKNPGTFSLRIGNNKPACPGTGISRIIAEINDAPMLSECELLDKALYYAGSGASIIDLGMPPGEGNTEKIPCIIDTLRSKIDVPLSIDSLNPREILAAADAGIDMILSIDQTNWEVLDSVNVPAVVIPRDAKGAMASTWEKKKKIFGEVIGRTGGRDLILDPVLDPLGCGFTGSLKDYILCREDFPDMPMMLGAGNVTELLDADSLGVNALLAGIASELSIDLLFTTEASRKTKGSVKELSVAADMMYLAKKRKQPPKDLGIDLLILKDKKKREDVPQLPEGLTAINAAPPKDIEPEDCAFRIFLYDNEINAVLYRGERPETRFTGGSASDIYKEIIGRKLIADMGHAAYLGRELAKAEIALKLGRDYVQDGGLF